jgi:hypothetical protein
MTSNNKDTKNKIASRKRYLKGFGGIEPKGKTRWEPLSSIKRDNIGTKKQEEYYMNKLLLSSFTFMMALIVTACGSSNDKADSTRTAKQSTTTENADQTIPGANRDFVKFPQNYDEGELFTTVTRGDTFEELYTSREAIEAVQDGQPIPSGTVITLKIFNDGELDRYFVMEKQDGWGAKYPADTRNGEWEYNAFTADGAVAYEEDIGRCFSCHANVERDDYVNKLDEMKSYELEELTGSKASSSESLIIGSHSEGWELKEMAAHQDGPQEVPAKERGLIGYENKDGIVQKVLMMIYLTQLKS